MGDFSRMGLGTLSAIRYLQSHEITCTSRDTPVEYMARESSVEAYLIAPGILWPDLQYSKHHYIEVFACA